MLLDSESVLAGVLLGECHLNELNIKMYLRVSSCLGQVNFPECIKHACLTNVLAFALQIGHLRKPTKRVVNCLIILDVLH